MKSVTKSVWGRNGLGAALLAVVLSVVAPLIHAATHPSHILSDGWSALAADPRPTGADKQSPATPHRDDCAVCQTLSAAVAAPSTPALSAPIAFEPVQHTAFAVEASVQTPAHLRPFGRAPPSFS